MNRFAILSHILPPAFSGQSVALYRLLRDAAPKDYCLISVVDYDQYTGVTATSRLPAPYFHLAPEGTPRVRGIPLRSIRENVNTAISIPFAVRTRAKSIVQVLEGQGCHGIVACSGDLIDLPAACAAARSMKVPFFPYLFDWYAFQFRASPKTRGRILASYARFYEPRIMKYAAGAFVPNEFMRDECKKRHGLDPVIVRCATDFAFSQNEPVDTQCPANGDSINIRFTGAVYIVNYDAFRTLRRALDAISSFSIRLEVISGKSSDTLKCAGLREWEQLPQVSAQEAQRLQREADILFLPLGFDTPYPEIVRTSAPTKTGDYLASGRPIIVYAPSDSFLAWYFREHECGVVVDRPEAEALKEAIVKIVKTPSLRQKLSRNALERARADFHYEPARDAFFGELDKKLGAPGGGSVGW